MDELEEKEEMLRSILKRSIFFQQTMTDGLQIGQLFVAQAVALLLYRFGIISSVLLLTAIFLVPLMLYQKGTTYRDLHMGGIIGYWEIVKYLSWTYLFAVIIGFVSYFLACYILFSNPEIMEVMEESIALATSIAKHYSISSLDTIESIKNITPLKLTSSIALNSLFNGLIYIYIISLFIKRSEYNEQ